MSDLQGTTIVLFVIFKLAYDKTVVPLFYCTQPRLIVAVKLAEDSY